MSCPDLARRRFLRLFASLPLGMAVGGRANRLLAMTPGMTPGARLSPEEALGRLILFLGPWSEAEGEQGTVFVRRFLASETATAPYLPELETEVVRLAESLAGLPRREAEVDLRRLSEKERGLIRTLSSHLYGLVDVRFSVSGQPPSGTCSGDRTTYTRPPPR